MRTVPVAVIVPPAVFALVDAMIYPSSAAMEVKVTVVPLLGVTLTGAESSPSPEALLAETT